MYTRYSINRLYPKLRCTSHQTCAWNIMKQRECFSYKLSICLARYTLTISCSQVPVQNVLTSGSHCSKGSNVCSESHEFELYSPSCLYRWCSKRCPTADGNNLERSFVYSQKRTVSPRVTLWTRHCQLRLARDINTRVT